MTKQDKITIFGSLAVLLVMAGFAGASDLEDAVRQEQLYCENVALYIKTDGQQGWPDYRELYNTMCVKEMKNE
jgi:hypothetical protein